MKSNIMVSVTMLAYNHGKFIERAVRSALNQKTNFEFEVIVGEDCSPAPDLSKEILLKLKEEYGERLILVLHEKNVGPRNNSNSIRRLAKGKYTCSLECDDYWTDEHKLQRQFDFLEAHTEFSACGSDNLVVDDNENILDPTSLGLLKDRIFTLKDYKKNGFTVHGNTIMRRANILSLENPKYTELIQTGTTMGDIYSFSLMYAYGPIYVFKEKWLAHRSGLSVDSSFSASNKTKFFYYTYMQIDMSKALEKYFDGRIDFSFIYINRIAEILFIKWFAKGFRVDKIELKKLYKFVGIRIVFKAKIVFFRKVIYRTILKIKKKVFFSKRCSA